MLPCGSPCPASVREAPTQSTRARVFHPTYIPASVNFKIQVLILSYFHFMAFPFVAVKKREKSRLPFPTQSSHLTGKFLWHQLNFLYSSMKDSHYPLRVKDRLSCPDRIIMWARNIKASPQPDWVINPWAHAFESKIHAETGSQSIVAKLMEERRRLGNNMPLPKLPAITTCFKIDSESKNGVGEHRDKASKLWQLLILGKHRLAGSPLALTPGEIRQLLRT